MGLKKKLLITCHSQIFGNFKVLILRKNHGSKLRMVDISPRKPSTIVYTKKKQMNITT